VLPLEFTGGQDVESLGLTGRETFELADVTDPTAHMNVDVIARGDDGSEKRFTTVARLDTPIDVTYFKQGGILPAVLRRLAG